MKPTIFLCVTLLLGGLALAQSEPAESKGRFKIPGFNRKEKPAGESGEGKKRSILPAIPGLKRDKAPRFGANSDTAEVVPVGPTPPALPEAIRSTAEAVPAPESSVGGQVITPAPVAAAEAAGDGKKQRRFKMPSLSMPKVPGFDRKRGGGKEAPAPADFPAPLPEAPAGAETASGGEAPAPDRNGWRLPRFRGGGGEGKGKAKGVMAGTAAAGAAILAPGQDGKDLKLEEELQVFFSVANPPEQSLAARNPDLRAALLAPSAEIEELRRNGIVGENSFGLLDLRGSLEESEQQILSLENRNRRAVYQYVADQSGNDFQKIAKLNARVIYDGLASGQVWVQNHKGEWTRK